MKKTLFTACLLALSLSVAYAQNESAVAYEGTYLYQAADDAVIRHWKDEFSVSVHTVPQGTVFVQTPFAAQCATTGASPLTTATVSDTLDIIQIYDLRLWNGIAFFCGSIRDTLAPSNYQYKGIIGYFSVQEFNTQNLTLNIQVFDSVRWFYRMQVYDGPAGDKVVALGSYRNTAGPTPQYYSIIMEDDIMSPATSCNYKYDADEILCDLVLTDNYVVSVGYQPNNNYAISLRRANRASVIPTIDSVHIFYGNTAEVVQNLYATKLKGDYIVAAYLHREASPDETFYTRLRVFDITDMSEINAQEFPQREKYAPLALAYDDRHDILTIVHPEPFTSQHITGATYFVQANPFTTGSYAATVLDPHFKYFADIDAFQSEYHVAIGGNRWYFQHTTAPQPNPNDCPKSEKIIIDPIAKLNTFPLQYSTPDTLYFSTLTLTVPLNLTQLNLICTDN